MLAIATAVAAATPTMPIMPNGNRAMAWRSEVPAFEGRLAGRTRSLVFGGALVDVGGGTAVTFDGLAADSTGMTIAVACVVTGEGLLDCGAAIGIGVLVAAGTAVVADGLAVDDAAAALVRLAAVGAAVVADGLAVGAAAVAPACLAATDAAVKAGGLTVGNVAALAGLDATEAFGEPAGLAVGRAAARAESAAAGATVGVIAAAFIAAGGHGVVAFASVGPNDATNVAAIARVAFASANASSAARDNNCMSSGLSTISIVSSSRVS